MAKLFLKALAGAMLMASVMAQAQAQAQAQTPTPAAATPEPQPNSESPPPVLLPTFSVTYTLENNYITAGTAEFTVKGTEEQGYQIVLQSNPTGLFRFSDKGKIREVAELNSLNAPFFSSKYTYTNFGNKQRSYVSSYDRQVGEATTVRNGNTETFNIETDAVDRLSMTLAVMTTLHNDPNIKAFSLKMLEQSGARAIQFISKGQATINTDIGKLESTKIDRQRVNSNRQTMTWFAAIGPNNLPIPVQIEQYKNDKMVVRLKVTSFTSQ